MDSDPFENPAGTHEEIIAATYRSLKTHGYADLTMQKIGDELDRSPSLVYHHYEDKDALVLACLESLLERFEAELGHGTVEDPRERLETVLVWWLGGEMDDEWRTFITAMLELRIQAVHDPAYQAHFTRSDRVFAESITALVRDGIAAGEFRECDPTAVAETLQTIFVGTVVRLSSSDDDEWIEGVHAELRNYLETRVYASD